MFYLNMVDYTMFFLSLSTWNDFGLWAVVAHEIVNIQYTNITHTNFPKISFT